MAKRVPGKEEFYETLRYFRKRVVLDGVVLRLNEYVTAPDLTGGDFDAVVMATGVTPRSLVGQ